MFIGVAYYVYVIRMLDCMVCMKWKLWKLGFGTKSGGLMQCCSIDVVEVDYWLIEVHWMWFEDVEWNNSKKKKDKA